MLSAQNTLCISTTHDQKSLRQQYKHKNRIQIRNFLDLPSADAIYHALANMERWNLVYMNNGTHVDSDANAIAEWPPEHRQTLETLVYGQATVGFQYMYCTVPIYDIYHQHQLPGHFLNSVFEFLNSAEFLEFVKTVADDDAIEFADAQATRFGPGHFLTCHDDAIDDKGRRVAYVLSLSPVWKPDWGGSLQFIDSKGNIDEGYTPTYNALCLFRVPSDHSVSVVAPFAGALRYSITGWLREGQDPQAR